MLENIDQGEKRSYEICHRTSGGYFQLLDTAKSYRILNTARNSKCVIRCVVGRVNINGKLLSDFEIGPESSVVIVGETDKPSNKLSK